MAILDPIDSSLSTVLCRRHLRNVPSIAGPIPPEELPKIFEDTNRRQSKDKEAMIRQASRFYPVFVDGKNFNSLDLIFIPSVRVNMSTGGPILQNLQSLEDTLQSSFDGLRTHHQLGSQNIKIFNHGCQAQSVTYFTATIMGTGQSLGQV
ncbi:hypothetical protein MMC22_007814 [Lobaria immixta]|nr:hypothetical protein [Lobaria immixta]